MCYKVAAMIIKSASYEPLPDDLRLRAGMLAEKQVAFYLHRAFAKDPRACVLHDLRLVDEEQPEFDGRPGVCQIDHLVVHPWGMFIVECKSAHGQVTVHFDQARNDDWKRTFQGRGYGIPSPIQQAQRQGDFLRALLQRHRESLLGKVGIGFRTISRVIRGTDQRGFTRLPIQLIVSLSEHADIRRTGQPGVDEDGFARSLVKADQVTVRIREELKQHEDGDRLLANRADEYGIWRMSQEESLAVSRFLANRHVPKVTAPLPQGPSPLPAVTSKAATAATAVSSKLSCKHCRATALTAAWGPYGYYWKCAACNGNTAMPVECSACGAKGDRGKVVRIRKEGPKYYRCCDSCGIEESIWTEVC